MQIARNGQAPFICSLTTNFSKDQNQLDGCPTLEESHYKCKQYIAVYNCQNMLKTLSFISSMFSSAKRSLVDSSALSTRVRDIPTINCRKIEQYCIAKAILQKGKKAELISIIKNGSLIVNKSVQISDVNTPSPLPELQAIIQCLMMAKKIKMRDFIVYFQHGSIKEMSHLKIQNLTLLWRMRFADHLLNQSGAFLCHNPNFVNHHPVIQEAMNKKDRRS